MRNNDFAADIPSQILCEIKQRSTLRVDVELHVEYLKLCFSLNARI